MRYGVSDDYATAMRRLERSYKTRNIETESETESSCNQTSRITSDDADMDTLPSFLPNKSPSLEDSFLNCTTPKSTLGQSKNLSGEKAQSKLQGIRINIRTRKTRHVEKLIITIVFYRPCEKTSRAFNLWWRIFG